MSDDSRQPWDPQEGETPAAFEAFCLYRDSEPAEQNLKSVSARHFHTTGEAHRRIRDWSAKYHWVARALAWVEHKNEQEQAAIQAALLEERKQAARERLETGRLAVRKVRERLEAIGAENDALPPGVLAALLKAGADLARIEDGESTERVDQTMRMISAQDLSDDELARIAAGSSR